MVKMEDRQKLICRSCQKKKNKNTFLIERECWWYSNVRRYSIVIILDKPWKMTLIVYCIVGSYKKKNILLLSAVSQVGPIRLPGLV